jgi:hypothetical protein
MADGVGSMAWIWLQLLGHGRGRTHGGQSGTVLSHGASGGPAGPPSPWGLGHAVPCMALLLLLLIESIAKAARH